MQLNPKTLKFKYISNRFDYMVEANYGKAHKLKPNKLH